MKKYVRINDLISFGGVILLVWSFNLGKHVEKFLENASYSKGIVINHEYSNDSKAGRPVVKYTAENNKEYTFTSSRGSYPLKHKRGETVPVIYPKTAPQKAQIDGYPNVWSQTIILRTFGICFIVIGIFSNFRAVTKGVKTWR